MAEDIENYHIISYNSGNKYDHNSKFIQSTGKQLGIYYTYNSKLEEGLIGDATIHANDITQ